MIITPPNGSRIKVESENGEPLIILPHPAGSVIKVFAILFIIFWLGMWAVGWWSAAKELVSGKNTPDLFLTFWLCGWTVGGVFAFWFLYRLLRPALPETMLLSRKVLKYDSGIPPFKFSFGFVAPSDYWKQLFPKRIQVDFQNNELSTLKLREHSSGNRLTLDYLNKRLDLATSITEVEKEWLYEKLQKKYF